MRDLRIVFMGTPDFAVGILKNLVENNYNIVGVITAPDKPAGRGKKIRQSAVKEYALTKGLNILQPTNLKDEAFNNELAALKPNLHIVVAFRMLPKIVWQLPEYGTFNLHASLLPDYRGAAPINWAIMNGDRKTGVTTFFIDEKIDTGEMIFQEEVPIAIDDTAGTLHDKLMVTGSELVLKTVAAISQGKVDTTPQPELAGTRDAFKIHKDTCKIDWNASIEDIYNKVRGLSPYPAAWTEMSHNGTLFNVKLYKVAIDREIHDLKVGTMIATKKELKVAVREGFIKLLELQMPGKKRMETIALLNGFQPDESSKMC